MKDSIRPYKLGSLVIAAAIIYAASFRQLLQAWLPKDYSDLITIGTFVIFYRALIEVYERWVWSYVHPKLYFGGFWGYSLLNNTTQRKQIGTFQVTQRGFEVGVPQGHVWTYETQNLVIADRGGRWESEVSFITENRLFVLFTMESKEPRTGSPQVMLYRGILNLHASKSSELVGRFYDLDDRVGHWGEVIARRLPGINSYSDAPVAARKMFKP